MKHIALLLFLSSLCAINFYFVWSPETARRYQWIPIKNDRALKTLHLIFAVVFLQCMLLVLYAFLNPRGEA